VTVKERPVHIRIAIASGDVETLRYSGSVGGRKSIGQLQKLMTKRRAAARLARRESEREDMLLRVQANEHIVPLDSESGEYEYWYESYLEFQRENGRRPTWEEGRSRKARRPPKKNR
jgi:hypothetical protein